MGLRALEIVREVLSREIERLNTRMDRMVRTHREKVEYSRMVLNGGSCSERERATGISGLLDARHYLDSCGPALSDMDDPCWVTLPQRDLGKHAKWSSQASQLRLVRDTLIERISKECVEMDEDSIAVLEKRLEASEICAGRRCCGDSEHFTTVGAAREFLGIRPIPPTEPTSEELTDSHLPQRVPCEERVLSEADAQREAEDFLYSQMATEADHWVKGNVFTNPPTHFKSEAEARHWLAEMDQTPIESRERGSETDDIPF